MILQQLVNDVEQLVGDLPPSMYDTRPVKWIVHLRADGRAQWPPEVMSGGGKRDRGKPMLVPFKNRTSAIRPLLLVDKLAYAWGQPVDHPRAAAEHRAFIDLLERCAAATGDADVSAIAAFLRNWDPEVQPLPAEMLPDESTIFCVEGRFPTDNRAVRAFWAREAGGDESAGVPGQCLVCGEESRVVERLPVVLKGIPQGQSSGVALVSANANAFESYGRAAALTSPICLDCGERFGKAANALLQDPRKHVRVGPVAYLCWAPEVEFDVTTFLTDPQPEDVTDLLQSAQRGRPPAPGDDSPFFAVALSAAISRVVVRSWLHSTVGETRRHLERWFRLQRLCDAYGAEGKPLSVFRLAVSLYREPRDIVGRVPELLLHAALHGSPLPDWLLLQAVRRSVAERTVTYPRAALIKAVLCSQGKEDPVAMERLDPNNQQPAYLCGRLLAELEAVQRVAINPRATLVDRYYGTASTAPASVFGILLRGAQPHLSKLRKERPGAHSRLQQSLEEIMQGLDGWPRTLTLQDQAVFALGYYQQRAEDRRAANEAKQKKLSAADAPVELADDTDTTA